MELQYRRHISFGNRKLPTTTGIFNICSATDCPSRKLGLCQVCNAGKRCYALKAEQMYPGPLDYRRRQERLWDSLTAETFAGDLLGIASRRRTLTTALRLNEAGDFRTQADVDKAERIAHILSVEGGIDMYCYTARSDLDFSKTRDLVVNGSGFRVHGEFRMILTPEERPKGYTMCVGNCRECSRCVSGGLTCVLPH